MLYDDVASNSRNPFPGQVFNAPTAAGVAGVDVWANIQKDYTGKDVTPENFLAILTGNATAVPAGKKVLKSGPNDNVFVFFSDHGGAGLLAFPDSQWTRSINISTRQWAATLAEFLLVRSSPHPSLHLFFLSSL